jgi:hypothetical protein
MDSIHQWDGALLLRCYRQIKAYVEALAGGNAAADSSFLSPIMVMVTESGDFLATMEEIVAWFKGYFSNKPTVTVKVRGLTTSRLLGPRFQSSRRTKDFVYVLRSRADAIEYLLRLPVFFSFYSAP